MISRILLFLVMVSLAGLARAADIEIPFTRVVLDNGLTVIVHEDHKAPIVAVNIWYHVGSKDEPQGRTGFAHLFEHLMFQGSENFDGEYLSYLEKLGATDLNATTWFDRTNYFQTVPKNALDTVLWLESDRMGHFAGAITQAKLDEQRGVVQNEKRQGENQPYGKVWETILKQLFPDGHPYSWETIGSMADLEAATLDDVRDWFATWYGPDNATLVLAGDVDTAEALEKVRRYFGDIPPGPPLRRYQHWIPEVSGERRQVMQDRVSQPRIYKAWTGPAWGTRDAHLLEMAVRIIGGDKNSRLFRRLVYEDRSATDATLSALSLEIAGVSYLVASAQPGMALADLETAFNEEIARFTAEGPGERELERVKVGARAAFVRGIEGVGGFGGKSDVLAENAVYGGDPSRYQRRLADIESATAAELADVARRWLGDDAFVLEVRPVPQLSAAEPRPRGSVPEPEASPGVTFPPFERATLRNGLELIVAERRAVPIVEMSLLLDAGYASDQFAAPGTASVAMSMLDEGAGKRSALEISEELALLGANISSGSQLDTSSVSLSALTAQLDPAMEIFADVVLRPKFPDKELERVRSLYLASIRQQKTRPVSMALRVLPRLLYGDGHAYGQPLTGSGTEDSVAGITRRDLKQFHDTWFKPDHATLVVVGDTTLAEMRPRIEKLFGKWRRGDVPAKNIAPVSPAAGNVLHLVDRPGSEQSVIFAGQLAPPRANPDEIAIQAMNDILGGRSSSRINMNLREDKGWSYGAYSLILDARGQRPLLAYAPVQTDRTADAVREIDRELNAIIGERPPTNGELDTVTRSNTLSLAGRWESAGAVLGSIAELITYGLPDDYWSSFARRVNALKLPDVEAAAGQVLDPSAWTWVVVGDRSRIGEDLTALGFDEIRLLDADGKPVADTAE